MRPEELALVTNDAVQRLIVKPRYSGKFSLRFELVCSNGGIRECAVGTEQQVTNDQVVKLYEKKNLDIAASP
ncbi:MAG TPA: hypothetical protein VKF42_09865 [Chitinivibrionales bacterium]|nr:hypothetical protein [Chitinivibrionales bacterium]